MYCSNIFLSFWHEENDSQWLCNAFRKTELSYPEKIVSLSQEYSVWYIMLRTQIPRDYVNPWPFRASMCVYGNIVCHCNPVQSPGTRVCIWMKLIQCTFFLRCNTDPYCSAFCFFFFDWYRFNPARDSTISWQKGELCIYIMITKNRTGSLLSLDPLNVSSWCHVREFFLPTLASGLLISDRNLHPDSGKAVLRRGSLLNTIQFKWTDQCDL